MAFTAKLYRTTTDLFDLSLGLRVAPGEGFDPFDTDIVTPQFADTVLDEGSSLISTLYSNREMVFPLHVQASKYGYADTKDGLNALLTRLGFILSNVTKLEWADDSASASTWFDVLAARFEPEANFRRQQRNMMSGVVRVWVRPFGHTGTYRQFGSVSLGSFPVVTLPSIAMVGDAPAKLALNISESIGTSVFSASTPFVVGYAITSIASTPRMWANASQFVRMSPWAKTASNAWSVVGASGAPGSQAIRWTASQVSNGAGSISDGYSLGAFTAGVIFQWGASEVDPGRNRVLALLRVPSSTFNAGGSAAVTFNAYDAWSAQPLGPTTVLNPFSVDGRWKLVDLGVFYSGTTPVENLRQRVFILGYDFKGNLAAAAGTTVTTVFECGGIAVLPEDSTYLISDTVSASALIQQYGVASYTISDDIISAAYAPVAGSLSGVALVGRYGRGKRSELPAAPTTAVQGADARYITAFAFAGLGVQNGLFGVDVKIQERFTFQR